MNAKSTALRLRREILIFCCFCCVSVRAVVRKAAAFSCPEIPYTGSCRVSRFNYESPAIKTLVTLLLLIIPLLGETSESAWENTVGKRFNNTAFSYPVNDPALPNVLIYGDSISIHYQLSNARTRGRGETSTGSMRTVATPRPSSEEDRMREPSRIPAGQALGVLNGTSFRSTSAFTISSISNKESENGQAQREAKSLPPSNTKNLEAMLHILSMSAYPESRLIFATTTPVPEGESGRVAGDAEKSTGSSRCSTEDHPKIAINESTRLTENPNQPEWWNKPGNVTTTRKARKPRRLKLSHRQRLRRRWRNEVEGYL